MMRIQDGDRLMEPTDRSGRDIRRTSNWNDDLSLEEVVNEWIKAQAECW